MGNQKPTDPNSKDTRSIMMTLGRAGPPSSVAFGDILSLKGRVAERVFPSPSGRWPATAGRMRGWPAIPSDLDTRARSDDGRAARPMHFRSPSPRKALKRLNRGAEFGTFFPLFALYFPRRFPFAKGQKGGTSGRYSAASAGAFSAGVDPRMLSPSRLRASAASPPVVAW